MAKVIPWPNTTLLPSGKKFILNDSFFWEINGESYFIPAGFTFDGKSTPWWLQSIFPRVDEYFPAALVHDWLCDKATTLAERHAADHAYFNACTLIRLEYGKQLKGITKPFWWGLEWLNVRLMYAAVRDYGWIKFFGR